MLAPWWWMSCRCNGFITRKPCFECKRLGVHIGSLSKRMCHIDKNGVLSIDRSSKNKHFIWINGKQQVKKGKHGGGIVLAQLREGDILQFGRYCSNAWITLVVKSKRLVTPNVKSKEDCFGGKCSVDLNSQEGKHHVFSSFERQFEKSHQSRAARKKSSWLKTAVFRKSRSLNACVSKESLECDEEIDYSAPNVISPAGGKIKSSLVSGSATFSPLKSEQQKLGKSNKTMESDNESNSEWSIHRRKRKYALPNFSAMKRVKQREPWHEESDVLSSCTSDSLVSAKNKAKKQNTVCHNAKEAPAVIMTSLGRDSQLKPNGKKSTPNGDADESSSDRSSKGWRKTSFATQNEQHELRSHREDSTLYLPECPTYDENSAAALKGTNSKNIAEIRQEGNPKKFLIGNKKDETKSVSLDKRKNAEDLTSQEWRNMQVVNDGTDNTLVRRSVSQIVTEQRLRLKDDKWLPEILRNAVVGQK